LYDSPESMGKNFLNSLAFLKTSNKGTVSSYVNGPWSYMYIHKIVHNSALNVALVLMNKHFFSSIKYFNEAIVSFVVLLNGFVKGFIMLK